jgi:hypothetical protein
MNEDIIKWARECFVDPDGACYWDEELEKFAALVRADEREACAKVCEARYMGDNNREDMEARRCAEAIRERKS